MFWSACPSAAVPIELAPSIDAMSTNGESSDEVPAKLVEFDELSVCQELTRLVEPRAELGTRCHCLGEVHVGE